MHEKYTDTCSTDRLHHLLVKENGVVYVAGNLNLIPREYDPMPQMAALVMRLISIGKAYGRGEDISFAVQSFCNQYGLLDFEKALVEKRYDDHSVKFYAGNVLGRKAATSKEYDDIFLPFQKEWGRQSRRKIRERVMELPMDENGVRESAPDYSQCEAVEWYGKYGMQIYELLRSRQSGKAVVLMPGNAELRYEFGSATARRHWYFDSLKSACDVWLMETLTTAHPAIRLCKRCGKAFIADSAKTEYCSASCRNVANVANSRKRKRAQTAAQPTAEEESDRTP